MTYQSDVTQMQSAGFSGQEVQDWSDKQATQMRQAGFGQDEVDSYQGMKAPAPGSPPVYGRLPTDDDFKNAATVILKGNDHPFYEKAVNSLKGLFSSTGVSPEEAVKASQNVPSFQQIMENGGDGPKGSYWQEAGRAAGSLAASSIQGLTELAAPNASEWYNKPLFTIGPNVDKPEDYWVNQKGAALQKWIDDKFPAQPEFEAAHPIKTGVVSGLAQMPELIATGGIGMGASAAHNAYDEAKQAGVPVDKAVEYAGKSSVLWGALGSFDVGVFMKSVERSAPGAVPWVVAKAQQALKSGATFAGTNEFGDWLSSEIGQASDVPSQYKPTLQRVVVNALTGATLGAITPSGVKEGGKPSSAQEAKPTDAEQLAEPSAAGTDSKLTPAYHFDSDSFGLKNAKGEFTQTGFASEDEAAKSAETQTKNATEKVQQPQQKLSPEVIDGYKKTISDEAEKLGFNLTPDQLQTAAKNMAESHNSEKAPEAVQPEKTGKEETPYNKVPAKPLSLSEFLAKNGGLKDEGGELAAMDADKAHINPATGKPIPFQRKLVRDDGMSLDEAALKAHQAGYFSGEERPDTNQFLDKLREDLGGNHQHSELDRENLEAHEGALAHNHEIDRVSNETGIETKGKTHGQFWDEVAKHYSLEQQAQLEKSASDSWKTEALEPEEFEQRPPEEIEHEWQQEQDAKHMEPVPASVEKPEHIARSEGHGETGNGQVGGSTEPSGRANEGASERSGNATGTGESDNLVRFDNLSRFQKAKQNLVNFGDQTAKEFGVDLNKWPRDKQLEYEKRAGEFYDARLEGKPNALLWKDISREDQIREFHGLKEKEYGTANENSAGNAKSNNVVLPRDLRGAKPRYGYGDKKFTLSFDSDIDKALYTTGQKTPNKRDADYRQFLKDNGFSDSDISKGSKEIRDRIKQMAKDHPDFEDKDKLSNIRVTDEKGNNSDDFLYHKVPSNEFSPEEIDEVPQLRDLRDFVKQIAPNSRFTIRDKGIRAGNSEAVGYYHPMKDLITVALTAPDKFNTAAHESLHAIAHLLTDNEYRTIVTDGLNRGLMEKYNIEENYSERPDVHQEEMIAHWFGDWAKDKRTEVSPETKNIFEKIKDVLSQIGTKVRQIFGTENTEDIFGKILSGEVGRRTGERLAEDREFYQKQYGEPTIGGVADKVEKRLQDQKEKDQEEKPTLGDAVRGIRDTFSPTSAGGMAKGTEQTIRQSYGESRRERSIAETALNEFARQATEMTPAEHSDFYNYVEGRTTGAQLKNKQFQAMADTVRDVYARFKDVLQAMPETRAMNFVTDYFTHQWESGQDEKIKEFLNVWRQQGSGRNLKQRIIPTIADGLAYGLKLEEPNPVRAVSKYAGSMSNYIASVNALRSINTDLGGSYYVDGKQPENYAPLVGRNAERIENARIDPDSGKLVPARKMQLYAPKEVADLYNAFYSKGFEDTKLKSAYMLARDAINTNTMMELGFSAYHVSTITMQSLNQNAGRVLRNFTAGDWQGVGQAIMGMVNPIGNFLKGQKLIEQYNDLKDHGVDMEETADNFAKANLRLGLDPLSNVSTHGGFLKSWQRGELPALREKLTSQLTQGYGLGAIKTAAQVVSRLVSDVAHPIFGVYVPAMKISAFHDLMGDWMRQHPDASDGEIASARTWIGDRIESRFGEMNMENIFWNKKAKELLGLGVRAPGWDIGLIDQAFGPASDIYHMVKDAAAGKKFDDKRLDRLSFLAGMAVVYAASNSLLTYLHTGVAPSDQKEKDFIAYGTGGTHKAFGEHPERSELPGHGRELIQMSPEPGKGPLSGIKQEAENKIASLPKNIGEALTNEDWRGKPLYNPKSKDPIQQTPILPNVLHVLEGFKPFSMDQLFDPPEGTHLTLAERFMGVRAAGAKIVNPEGLKGFNERKNR